MPTTHSNADARETARFRKKGEIVRYDVAIIGGGAAGLYLATRLAPLRVALAEMEPRVGRKLLATGNGRCNLTFCRPLRQGDYNCSEAAFFLGRVSPDGTLAHFRALGLRTRTEDERVYPYSLTASSVLDCLRRGVGRAGTDVFTDTRVTAVRKTEGEFVLDTVSADGAKKTLRATAVVLATGSDAGFGRDSLSLYTELGHTRRSFAPSLVPLLTDKESVKGLSGVRVRCALRAGDAVEEGEVLFRDNGLSGIAAMNISALHARGKLRRGDALFIDFVPETPREILEGEFAASSLTAAELLGGLFHSKVAERIAARAGQSLSDVPDAKALAVAVKDYALIFEGVRGKDSAQVMSGGLPLSEFDGNLMSKVCEGAYAAGEALDVDGVCGGFNLQWAWTSAEVVARALSD